MNDNLRPELAGVPDHFDAVAPRYDVMVGLNPGYHRHLRRSAARLRLAGQRQRPLRLLDLGCGTGASTRALLAVHPEAEIVAVDASAGMLAAARAKEWPATVRFLQARAEDILSTLDGEFDGVLAAYLLRNVTDRDGVLRALRQLLAPGGRLAVHEYSVADSRRAQLTWRAVCRGVVVPTGRLMSRHTALYRYLERSVLEFDGVRALESRMQRVGFDHVVTLPMGGWQRGIVHTFLGRRP